jgi:hypothetical protein
MHQFARDVVNGGNVIRVDRVTKPETVREKRRAQQHRKVAKSHERPAPCRQIEQPQERVDRDYLGFGAAGFVIGQSPQEGGHRVPLSRCRRWVMKR